MALDPLILPLVGHEPVLSADLVQFTPDLLKKLHTPKPPETARVVIAARSPSSFTHIITPASLLVLTALLDSIACSVHTPPLNRSTPHPPSVGRFGPLVNR